ncbi:MAG: ribonuclease H-like domain-containing protein [Bacteroidetes bacterium]|nr:ribonuclease H-like domain-containing protein [Bacteroidota bacterium]
MDSILFGHNTEEKIVAVHQVGETAMRVVKREGNSTISVDRKFYPFFFLNSTDLVGGFDKKFWTVELAGGNYYKYLCIFRKWADMHSALRLASQNFDSGFAPSRRQSAEPSEVYIKLDPVFQFLMQTGITLFKGMGFSDLRRMQLDIETFSRIGFSDASRPEDRIILISLSDNSGWEHIISGREKTETEMFSELQTIIRNRDPDVIEGHNILGFDFPYIARRCEMNRVKLRIGRDNTEIKVSTIRLAYGEKEVERMSFEIPGRHVIDTLLLIQSYDATRRELESYGLKNVAKHFGFASETRTYIDGRKISETWLKDPDLLIKYALDDVRETRQLADMLSQTRFYLAQMLPYNYGQIPGGSATKIESLFVREYLRKKHSIPRPQVGRQTSGGYTDVFLQGIAGPVVHADVESLYPSIMISYKVSPATDDLGVFQKSLRHLTKLRLDTKKQMKVEGDSVERAKLDAMQSSLKILINSFYGYLGYSRGIFNDYSAADVVTETGQKILRQMISQITWEGGTLVEVDTDGLYFVLPSAFQDDAGSDKFVSSISKMLPSGINLALDGRYPRMLSYKKKNYALLENDGKVKIRGSALVSRSMERFGRDFIHKSIELILHEDFKGIHELFVDYNRKIMNREFSIDKMVHTETVRESIEEYQASVKSAKRNRSASFEAAIAAGITVRPGGRISYYITGSDPAIRSFSNAKLYDENEKDKRDYNVSYYVRKLSEYAERFSELFTPEDFNKIFAFDDDLLFSPPLDGVKVNTREVTSDEEKVEESESE